MVYVQLANPVATALSLAKGSMSRLMAKPFKLVGWGPYYFDTSFAITAASCGYSSFGHYFTFKLILGELNDSYYFVEHHLHRGLSDHWHLLY